MAHCVRGVLPLQGTLHIVDKAGPSESGPLTADRGLYN